MKRLTLTLAAVGALVVLAADAQVAEAGHGYYGQRGTGVHIGGRNFHIDIGNPHGYGRTSYYSGRSYYGGGAYYGTRGSYARPHLDWHDTSHYDYHPGYYVPHGNHVDYVPGHYDFHREGHWDVHRGGHGRHRW